MLGLALMQNGFATLARRDTAAVLAAFRESLALFWEQGARTFITIVLEGVGFALAASGQVATAARVLGAAAAQREERSMPRMPTMQAPYEEAVRRARHALGADDYVSAWKTGHALPIAHTVTELLQPVVQQEPEASRPARTEGRA